jgi:lipopolysaccharide/colanic/teichoic acid biosynthesis glycosyltransferase
VIAPISAVSVPIASAPSVGVRDRSITGRPLEAAIAIVGLVLLAPLLLMLAVAIVLDSSGAPLYWQERVGQFGRRFRLVKLRTMIADAEADGRAVWAEPNDRRVTRVGALVRRAHLDELPQLWNVLRGEMSLIGPRPERPEFIPLLAGEIPDYLERLAIRPGMTGWAQVNFRYGSSVEDAAIKLEHDLHYVRNRSLVLDGLIVARTITAMLRLRGR